jgi:hypothetical protein
VATQVTYNEIQCYVAVHNSLSSNRFIYAPIQISSDRYVYLSYRKLISVYRQVYFQTNPLNSDRSVITSGIPQVIVLQEIGEEQQIPYFISPDNELFIKLELQPYESKIIEISTTGNQPQDTSVPTLFDDFTSGEVDSTKWSATADNISFTDTTIVCSYGDTNLTTTDLGTLDNYVIKYRGIQYDDSSRWSCGYHDEEINTENSATTFYEGSDSTWTNFMSTGTSSALANLPVTSWHTVEIEYDKETQTGKFYFNGELKLTRNVSLDTATTTYVKFYSCRRMEYDWILIYRRNPSSVSFDIEQISDTTYRVTIKNNSSETINQELKVEGFAPSSDSLSVYIPAAIVVYKDYFTYDNNRFAYTEKALPGQNDRWITFIPNAGIIVSTTQVILPFIVSSDRNIFIGNTPITQRYVSFPISESTERGVFVNRTNCVNLSSPITELPIGKSTERSIYFETLDKISSRYATFVFGTESDRTLIAQFYQYRELNSPKVYQPLSGFFSDRTIVTKSQATYTDRYALAQLNPDSIRYIKLCVGINDERAATYLTNQLKLLHDVLIEQCHPYYSERYAVTKGYINSSERFAYGKVGDWYSVIRTYSQNPKINLISTQQSTNIFRITSTNIDSITINGEQSLSGLSKLQRTIDVTDITGISDSPNINISAISSTGQPISDSIEKKQKTLTIGKFIANVGIRHSVLRYAFTIGGSRWEERGIFTSGYIIESNERNSLVTPYNYTDRGIFTSGYIIEADERDGIISVYETNTDERTALLSSYETNTDERNVITLGKSADVLVQDSDGNVYLVYVDSENNELAIKLIDESYSPSYVKDDSTNDTYKVVLDDEQNITIELVNDVEVDSNPIVKDEDGNEYELYVEDNELNYRLIT